MGITGRDGPRNATRRASDRHAEYRGCGQADDDRAVQMAMNHQRIELLPQILSSRPLLGAAAICVLLVVAFQPVPAVAQYCQPVTPAAPFPIWGVDSAAGRGCGEVRSEEHT